MSGDGEAVAAERIASLVHDLAETCCTCGGIAACFPCQTADEASHLLAALAHRPVSDGAALEAAVLALADELSAEASEVEQDGTPEAEVEQFVLRSCATALRALIPGRSS